MIRYNLILFNWGSIDIKSKVVFFEDRQISHRYDDQDNNSSLWMILSVIGQVISYLEVLKINISALNIFRSASIEREGKIFG